MTDTIDAKTFLFAVNSMAAENEQLKRHNADLLKSNNRLLERAREVQGPQVFITELSEKDFKDRAERASKYELTQGIFHENIKEAIELSQLAVNIITDHTSENRMEKIAEHGYLLKAFEKRVGILPIQILINYATAMSNVK